MNVVGDRYIYVYRLGHVCVKHLERTASNFNASASSRSRARARKARGSSRPLARVDSRDHSEKFRPFIYVICGYAVYAISRELDEGT